MRRLLVPALVLMATLLARPAAAQTLKRETVDRLKAATVFIQVSQRDYLSGDEEVASGSGFFFHPNGFVVTNWHVVRPFGVGFIELPLPRELTRIKVFINSGTLEEEVVDAALVAVDKEADLAILATPKRNVTCLEAGRVEDLMETSPLWVVGFPLGEKFAIIERGPEVTLGRGTVTALRHDDQGKLQVIQTDAQFDSGNSGGPLTNAEGRVLGIAQSIVVNTRSLNFAVPVTAAVALLEQARPNQPQPPKGKVTFCATPDA